jgi:hypothetical protein
MTQPSAPPPGSINMHQQKLYSLVLGGVGLLGMILPWANIDNGMMSRSAGNGFAGWGLLSLFGVVAILVSSLAGDKTVTYDQNMRYLAIGGFGGITLGAFISFMQVSGNAAMGIKSGIGVWFCIIAGVLGLLWVTGVIKISSNTPPKQ